MIKHLIFSAFSLIAMGANAGQYVCQANSYSLEEAGIIFDRDGEGISWNGATDLEAGTILAKGEAGSIATAYDDAWAPAVPFGGYQKVRVDTLELTLDIGAVGLTTPVFENYASGVMSAGDVFEITPAKDGWVTVFTRMNPDNAYVVFEDESVPVSYTLGYADGKVNFHYSIPCVPETNRINFEDYLVGTEEDLDTNGNPRTYFVPAGGELGTAEVVPQKPWITAGLAELPDNNPLSTGFLTFRVTAGHKYYFSAIGYRAQLGTFVLTEGNKEPDVIFYEYYNNFPEVYFESKDSQNFDYNFDPSRMTCEATAESLENAGLVSGKKLLVFGGKTIAKGGAGTIALAYKDEWGIMTPCGAYKNVRVGDVDLTLDYGAVGNTNPTFSNYASGVMSAGAVFEITPEKDGWVTLFTKMNPNKQYVVFEGENGPMSYTLGYSNGMDKIHYTLPYDPQTYWLDFEQYFIPGRENDTDYEGNPSSETYFVAAGGELGTADVKPQFPWKVAGLAQSPSDNTGFLTFRVKAGEKYYYGALGSKSPCGSFVLTEGDEPPVVTFLATDQLPEVIFGNDDSGEEENPGEDSGDDSGETWDPDRMTCEASASSLKAAGFLQDEKVDIIGDVIFAEGAAGTIATAYEDLWGFSVPCGGYQNVRVGDIDLTLSYGAAGNTNPIFFNYANGVMYEGGVFKITPAKDGWLTLFTKMKPYKQYVVFENMTGPLSYILGYSNGTEKIHYSLPYDPETYFIDFNAKDANTYFVPAGGDGPKDVKPQFPYIVAGLEDTPSDDTGFLTFNVLEGMTYYFAALGTKAPLGSFVLTEGDEMPVVTFLATDTLPEVIFDPRDVVNNNGDNGNNGDDNNGDNNEGNDTEGDDNNSEDNDGNENGGNDNDEDAGVNIIEWNPEEDDAPVYNILGQKVGSNAKGFLIRKGKKFIRR